MKSLDIQSNIEAFSFAAYLSFLPRLTRKRQEKSTNAVKDERSEVNHIVGNACALFAEDSKGKVHH